MQGNWLGQLTLADERKVDIPVVHSIIVAEEYTVDLHTSSIVVDGLNKNAMTCNDFNEKSMGMSAWKDRIVNEDGVDVHLNLVCNC